MKRTMKRWRGLLVCLFLTAVVMVSPSPAADEAAGSPSILGDQQQVLSGERTDDPGWDRWNTVRENLKRLSNRQKEGQRTLEKQIEKPREQRPVEKQIERPKEPRPSRKDIEEESKSLLREKGKNRASKGIPQESILSNSNDLSRKLPRRVPIREEDEKMKKRLMRRLIFFLLLLS